MFNRIRIGAGQRWVPDSRLFVVATAALLVCGSLNPLAVVVGDPVMEWNQIAVTRTLNASPAQAPVQQTRTMAIVQVSIHDAINGIVGRYRDLQFAGTRARRRVSRGGGDRGRSLRAADPVRGAC